jgi:hypothetical protein
MPVPGGAGHRLDRGRGPARHPASRARYRSAVEAARCAPVAKPVRWYMEVQAGAYCKTVGSAYVGSNPTPATTCENGPLAAETRPGGPFSSCHAMYQGASLRVDAWQCARTYGVQRPGKTSGACNRSLCGSSAADHAENATACLSLVVPRFVNAAQWL